MRHFAMLISIQPTNPFYFSLCYYRYGEKRKGSESAKELSGIALLSATMNQCKKPNQQLLVPITVWIGMEQAFIGADFTQVSVYPTVFGVHFSSRMNF